VVRSVRSLLFEKLIKKLEIKEYSKFENQKMPHNIMASLFFHSPGIKSHNAAQTTRNSNHGKFHPCGINLEKPFRSLASGRNGKACGLITKQFYKLWLTKPFTWQTSSMVDPLRQRHLAWKRYCISPTRRGLQSLWDRLLTRKRLLLRQSSSSFNGLEITKTYGKADRIIRVDGG
jgi:hypothetical protein